MAPYNVDDDPYTQLPTVNWDTEGDHPRFPDAKREALEQLTERYEEAKSNLEAMTAADTKGEV